MKSNTLLNLLLVVMLITGCYKHSDYDPESLDESTVIKEMTITPVSIPADGVSSAIIKVLIPENADIKTVKFTCSNGTFDQEEASVEAYKGVATIKLLAGTTIDEDVNVVAEIGGVKKSVTAEFTRAFPQSIRTEVSKFEIETGWANELTMTVKLKRDIGVVTPGAKVVFFAITDSGQPIGAFRDLNDESDSNGQTTAIFSAGKPIDDYTGQIYLIGTASNAGVNMLSDTATVMLIEP